MLEVEHVVRRFGGLVAINDVSMTITKDEIVALIGPNGAGKTTLFNLIAGVFPVDSGRISFKGQSISGLGSAKICSLGLVRTFQIPQLFSSMSVQETVMIGALMHYPSIGQARRKAHEVLELVGLHERALQPSSTLTIAGKKRLEIARALAAEPQMILLDEVMAGLNQPEIVRLLELIRALRARGMTVLLVEHNIEAVLNVADRIVVLDQGRKIADGPPREVLNEKSVIGAYLGDDYVLA